jgi:hypothetical protein
MAIIMLTAASLGSQVGATATRFINPSRIRVLFGITILSGSVAIGLKQIAESAGHLEFLSSVASVVLLGVSGAMCVLIAVLLLRARRR